MWLVLIYSYKYRRKVPRYYLSKDKQLTDAAIYSEYFMLQQNLNFLLDPETTIIMFSIHTSNYNLIHRITWLTDHLVQK